MSCSVPAERSSRPSGPRPNAWSARPREPPPTRPSFGEIDELERTNARAAAEQGAALARRVGFDAGPLVARSDRSAWRAILDLGAEHDARAIVVGSHGRVGLTDVLLGSVSSRVVHHADRPVLVVRTKRSS